jgi:type I restriction enzyme M protein
MLVENSLVAVVSLPAGCFNPYSGVKTSILILDKSLAKAADTIAFFKVENDGFGLGAQRRAIEKNDLPQVQAELAAYLQALRTNASTESILALTSTGQIVPKEKLAANGDYNLSGERYREGAVQSTHFPWRTVESLVETVTPPTKIQKTAFGIAGRFPIIDQSQDAIAGWTDDESTLVRPTKPLVIFGDHTCAIKLVETPFAQGADGTTGVASVASPELAGANVTRGIVPIRFNPHLALPAFGLTALCSDSVQSQIRLKTYGATLQQINIGDLRELQIPLPPLATQHAIVAEIEAEQALVAANRELITRFEQKIQATLARIWGEDESVPAEG